MKIKYKKLHSWMKIKLFYFVKLKFKLMTRNIILISKTALKPIENCWIVLDNKKCFTKFNLTRKNLNKFDYLEKIDFSDGKTEYMAHRKNKGKSIEETVKILAQQNPKKVIVNIPPMYIEASVYSTWVRKPKRFVTSFDTKDKDFKSELEYSFHQRFSVDTTNEPEININDSDAISSDTDFDWSNEIFSRNFKFQVIQTDPGISTVVFYPILYFTIFKKLVDSEQTQKFGPYYFGLLK